MALPQTINTATPASSDSPSGAPALFQNTKQFLVDVFGITDNTAYNVKAMAIDPTTGVVTIQVAGFTLKTAVLTQGTITDPALNLSSTVTWNDVADTFTAWKLVVTDTNSAAASLLMDLQVSGSKFSVTKAGLLTIASNLSSGGVLLGAAGSTAAPTHSFTGDPDSGLYSSGANVVSLSLGNAEVYRFAATTWSLLSDSAILALGASSDVLLVRDAAATLALKNGTTAQTLYIYGTTTGPKRLKLSHTGTAAVIESSTDDIQIGGTGGTIILHSTGTNTLQPAADNSVDLGISATARWRNLFLSGTTSALGTIASGLWNGTAIGALYGGTGQNTSASTGVPSISAGTWSVAARLTAALGGTNIDTSGSTGVPTISAGTWSVAAQLTALRGGTGVDGSSAANGKILIGNGGGYTLANVTPDNSVKITNGAGSLSIAAYDPETKTFFWEDFFGCDIAGASAGTNHAFQNRWWIQGGTTTSTTLTGGILRVLGNGSAQGAFMLAADTTYMTVFSTSKNLEFRVRFNQQQSTAGTRRIGLDDGSSTFIAPTDGIYLEHAASGAISLVCRASGVQSTLASGVSASSTFHTFRVIATGTSSVEMYVDGVSVGTIVSNIPSVNLAMGGNVGSTSATAEMRVDYMWLVQDR